MAHRGLLRETFGFIRMAVIVQKTNKAFTPNAVEKARKEESEARARVEQYALEGANVPYTPGTLTSEELAVHSAFFVDEEEEAKGGYRRKASQSLL